MARRFAVKARRVFEAILDDEIMAGLDNVPHVGNHAHVYHANALLAEALVRRIALGHDVVNRELVQVEKVYSGCQVPRLLECSLLSRFQMWLIAL